MPNVSIVIPNYNHARFLPKRIESVLRQTYQDFELILLDDCSKDDSRSILRQYAADPRVRVEFNEVNSGSTFKQWNKGVRMARGRYVWIAESDDFADERLLATLVSRLEANPSVVFANCRSWQVNSNDETEGLLDVHLANLHPQRWAGDFTADGRDECLRYLLFTNTVQSASSVVFRREAYWAAGGADESLAYCGDWKMWASMALIGGAVVHVGETLNYYRVHDTTVTSRAKQSGIRPAETLHVIKWILERAVPEKSVHTKLCEELAPLWVPAVLSNRIPLFRRRAILRDARAIDPHALRRSIRPALCAFRLTVLRRYRSFSGGFSVDSSGAIFEDHGRNR
jgi:glycosyltransferase involved in cell wall biosynthesis